MKYLHSSKGILTIAILVELSAFRVELEVSNSVPFIISDEFTYLHHFLIRLRDRASSLRSAISVRTSLSS